MQKEENNDVKSKKKRSFLSIRSIAAVVVLLLVLSGISLSVVFAETYIWADDAQTKTGSADGKSINKYGCYIDPWGFNITGRYIESAALGGKKNATSLISVSNRVLTVDGDKLVDTYRPTLIKYFQNNPDIDSEPYYVDAEGMLYLYTTEQYDQDTGNFLGWTRPAKGGERNVLKFGTLEEMASIAESNGFPKSYSNGKHAGTRGQGTIYREELIQKHTIKYDANDGKIRDDSFYTEEVEDGEDYVLISDEPVRANYKFAGWAASIGGTYFPEETIKNVTQDITLTAIWKQDECTVKVVDNYTVINLDTYEIKEITRIRWTKDDYKVGDSVTVQRRSLADCLADTGLSSNSTAKRTLITVEAPNWQITADPEGPSRVIKVLTEEDSFTTVEWNYEITYSGKPVTPPPTETPTPTPTITVTPTPTTTPTPTPQPTQGAEDYVSNYYYFTTDKGYTLDNIGNSTSYYMSSQTTPNAGPLKSHGVTKRSKAYYIGTDAKGNTWYFRTNFENGYSNASEVHPAVYNGYDACTSEVRYITELEFPSELTYNGRTYPVVSIGGGGATYHEEQHRNPTESTTTFYEYHYYSNYGEYNYEYIVSNDSLSNSYFIDQSYCYGVLGNGCILSVADYYKSYSTTGAMDIRQYVQCHYVYNTTLKKVTIPDSVTKIEQGAFLYCQALEEIVGGKGVKEILHSGFRGASDKTPQFSEYEDSEFVNRQIRYIYNSVENNSYYRVPDVITDWEKSVRLSEYLPYPDSEMSAVTLLEEYCFANRSNMKDVVIQNTVTAIYSGAFSGCELDSIKVGANVSTFNRDTDYPLRGSDTLGTNNQRNYRTIIYTTAGSQAVNYGQEHVGYYRLRCGYNVIYKPNGVAGADFKDLAEYMPNRIKFIDITSEYNSETGDVYALDASGCLWISNGSKTSPAMYRRSTCEVPDGVTLVDIEPITDMTLKTQGYILCGYTVDGTEYLCTGYKWEPAEEEEELKDRYYIAAPGETVDGRSLEYGGLKTKVYYTNGSYKWSVAEYGSATLTYDKVFSHYYKLPLLLYKHTSSGTNKRYYIRHTVTKTVEEGAYYSNNGYGPSQPYIITTESTVETDTLFTDKASFPYKKMIDLPQKASGTKCNIITDTSGSMPSYSFSYTTISGDNGYLLKVIDGAGRLWLYDGKEFANYQPDVTFTDIFYFESKTMHSVYGLYDTQGWLWLLKNQGSVGSPDWTFVRFLKNAEDIIVRDYNSSTILVMEPRSDGSWNCHLIPSDISQLSTDEFLNGYPLKKLYLSSTTSFVSSGTIIALDTDGELWMSSDGNVLQMKETVKDRNIVNFFADKDKILAMTKEGTVLIKGRVKDYYSGSYKNYRTFTDSNWFPVDFINTRYDDPSSFSSYYYNTAGFVSAVTGTFKIKINSGYSYNAIIRGNMFETDAYVFKGWNTRADGSGNWYTEGDEVPVSAALTLYAQWDVVENRIVYHKNHEDTGDGIMEDTVLKHSVTSTKLSLNEYTRYGYVFTEWNTKPDGSGTSYEDGAEISNLKGTLDLYAQWRPTSYTVQYAGDEIRITPVVLGDAEIRTWNDELVRYVPIEPFRKHYIISYNVNKGGKSTTPSMVTTLTEEHTEAIFAFEGWHLYRKNPEEDSCYERVDDKLYKRGTQISNLTPIDGDELVFFPVWGGDASKVTLPEAECEGYYFYGWAETATETDKAKAICATDASYNYKKSYYTPKRNGQVLYGFYIPKTSEVALDDGAATTTGQGSVTMTFDAKAPDLTEVPTRERYKFRGYYTEPDGYGKQVYDQDGKGLVTWNTVNNLWSVDTLYAYWVPKSLTSARIGIFSIDPTYVVEANLKEELELPTFEWREFGDTMLEISVETQGYFDYAVLKAPWEAEERVFYWEDGLSEESTETWEKDENIVFWRSQYEDPKELENVRRYPGFHDQTYTITIDFYVEDEVVKEYKLGLWMVCWDTWGAFIHPSRTEGHWDLNGDGKWDLYPFYHGNE